MFIFVDTEGTGLSSQGGYLSHCPITMSFVITDDALNKLEVKTIKSKPLSAAQWTSEAEAVHSITLADANRFQSGLKASHDVLRLLDKYKITSHNSTWVEHSLKLGDRMGFDLMFVLGLFVKHDLQFEFYKRINVSNSISTITLGKKAGYKQNKLDLWAKRLGLYLDHHNSESDALMCYEIFKHLGGTSESKRNDLHFGKQGSGTNRVVEQWFQC